MNGTINSTTIKNDNDKIIINKLWLSNVTFFENENETTTAEKITSNITTTSSSSQNNNGEQITTLSHSLPLDSTFSKPEREHIEQKKEYIVAEIENDQLIVINPIQEDANNVTTNLDVEIKNPKILRGEKILMTKDGRRICGIKNCYNTEGRKGDGSLLTLFRYPKDDPVLNKLWIKYTYDFLNDKNIPISDACTLICSDHFDQNDLQSDNRKSRHNLKRYKLKKGAYPKIIQKTNAANQLISESSELNKSNMMTTRKRMSDSKQDLMEDEMAGVNSSISPAKKICLVNPEKSMTYKEQKSKTKIDEHSTNSKISCQNEFLNNITMEKSKSLNNLQKPSIANLKPVIQNNQELMSSDDFQSAILIDDSNMNLESEISASNNSNDGSKQIEKSEFSTSNNNYESRRIENKSDSELIKSYTIKILKLKKILLEKNKMILEIKKNHSLEEYSRIKYQKQKEPDLTLHKKIAELMKKIKQLEIDNRNITEKNRNEYYKSLQNIFTDNQINILLGKTNKCNWTLKEILDANKLHSMSSDNVYMYLVKDLKYPLPSLSIVQYYLSMLNIDFFNNNGICRKNLEFMKLFANIKNDIERITVLSICEFKLEKLYFYNENTDEINDPKKCIQVILAYGLFSNWKQPIYMNHYDENNEINSNILCKLIKKLDKYGFNTVALVTNCRKRKIWKELNITIKKPYFEVDINHNNDDNNQNTNENANTNTNSNYSNKTKMKNIYVLFDSSDLLRILRCWFLDSGFILKDKTAVTKELYEELIENYSNDVQLLYGFKKDHIKHNKRHHCKYYNNQDYEIKLSEDLMSDNAANALREFQYYEPSISEFFDTVDKWYKFVRNKNFRKTLYTNDEEQNLILNRMYSLIKSMRHAVRQKPLNYQKAILISIESLKRLYDTVCNYCSEISLDKLSLDSSKRFYNDLLLYGNCSGVTPSFIELPIILKRLLLTPVKNEQFLIDSKLLKLNTSIDNDEEYLSIILLNHYNALQYPENLQPQSCDNLPPTSESEPSSSDSTLFYPSKEFKSKDITYGKNFISEDECFPYVIGWIVKNLKARVPKLCANSQADFLHVPSQIIDGELIRPSKWSIEISKILEQDFISYHDKGLRRKAVVKGLIKKLIDKYKTIPDDVIKVFIHQRTLIRIQFLNLKLNSNTMKTRQKKMKKLQWKRKNTIIAENFIIDNNYDQMMLQATYLPPASTNVLPPSTLSSQAIINPPTSQQIMSSEPITTTTTAAAVEDEIFPTMATLTNSYNDIIEEIISTETEYPIVDANQPMVLGLRDGLVIGSSVDDYNIIVDR